MSVDTPEFSRLIDRRGITDKPVHLAANEAERTALARRFAINSISSLEADIALTPQGEEVAATGTIKARVVQACAVSGDDLPASIVEEISLRFVPESQWADHEAEEVDLDEADLDAIPYNGTSFDLGEAVAQSLALAIDPFATGPNAENARKQAGIKGDDAPSGPLAEALGAAFKKK